MSDDPVLAKLRALIDEHGWAVRHVGAGTEPGEAAFSYTIGLTAFGHPEAIVTGLPFKHSQIFLNNIGFEVRDGKRFRPGDTTEDFTEPGAPVTFIAVEDTSGLTAVVEVYGSVTALQMVWPDSAGHLSLGGGLPKPARGPAAPGSRPRSLNAVLTRPLPGPGRRQRFARQDGRHGATADAVRPRRNLAGPRHGRTCGHHRLDP